MIKRLLRRPWLSLLSLVIGAILCTALCYLSGYLDAERARLAEIRDSYDILCVVSDVGGTKTDQLGMSRVYSDFILNKTEGIGAYIRDPRMVKSFSYASELGGGNLVGVSSPRCSAVLDESIGGGYEAPDGFFESEEYICLVSQASYNDYMGQIITLQLTDSAGASPQYPNGNGHGEVEFEVVGWYRGDGAELYMPYPASQNLAMRLSGIATTDSASFLVADNAHIEELIEAASSMLSEVDPTAVAPKGRFGFIVYDEQYRATLAAMEQNIQRLTYLLPLITLLSLGAGFLVGFLATRGEARTYALMRSIGVTRRQLFFGVLFEQMLLPLLAALVVGAVMQQPVFAVVFLICHAIGCGLAIARSVRVAPNAILREQE